jgi:hypothetical protein
MSQHPTGRFTATVIKAEVGESQKKGTPGVFFQFRTEAGEIDGSLWLTEKEFRKADGSTSSPLHETLRTLRLCFGFNDDFNTLPAQIEGRECSITVEMEPSQNGDKEFARVKWINPIRAAAKPAATGLLARLSAQAKRIAKPADMPAPAPRSAPAPTRAPAAPINDEDVPF